jgi:hypothetical protein
MTRTRRSSVRGWRFPRGGTGEAASLPDGGLDAVVEARVTLVHVGRLRRIVDRAEHSRRATEGLEASFGSLLIS